MSTTQNFPFGKMVPGFDFLQSLATSAVKGASQALPQLPNLGNWVAPTLSLEELEKRITELKAVQFWLDQNAIALKATIQALEVQKMTLATLKGMNVAMGDVAGLFKLKEAQAEEPTESPAKPKSKQRKAAKTASKGAAGAAATGVVDPVQWWGALTQQFQNIAATAMTDAAQKGAMDATRNMATGLAKEALRTAGGLAVAARDSAVRRASGAAKTKAATATQSTQSSRSGKGAK